VGDQPCSPPYCFRRFVDDLVVPYQEKRW
jgi:hypothetical protein